MTRHLFIALALSACGGEPFTGEDFFVEPDGSGGDVAASSGGSDASGGSSSSGGSLASAGGSPAAAGGAGAVSTGGAPAVTGGASSGGRKPGSGGAGTGGIPSGAGGSPPAECTPGERDCGGVAARLCALGELCQARVCSAAGRWTQAEICTYACLAGACGDCHEPGAKFCPSTTEQATCNATGHYDLVRCEGSEKCLQALYPGSPPECG